MFIAIQGVKRNARSEALWLLLYMEKIFTLNAILGVKLYAHCYTLS